MWSDVGVALGSLLRRHPSITRLKGYGRVVRLLWNPANLSPREFAVEYYGSRFKGSINSHIDWNVLFLYAYDRAWIDFVRQLLRTIDKPVIFDVGANVGDNVLAWAPVAGHLHAFEPFGPIRARLTQNVTENNLSNVEIHSFGLSNTNEIVRFLAPSNENGGTGRVADASTQTGEAPLIEIEVRTGDDFVDELPGRQADFIKIDVEGHEPEVLLGLSQTIRRSRPIIMMELNGDASYLADIVQDYQIFAMERVNAVSTWMKCVDRGASGAGLRPRGPGDNIVCIPKERLSAMADVLKRPY